jgi:hypothetical protein
MVRLAAMSPRRFRRVLLDRVGESSVGPRGKMRAESTLSAGRRLVGVVAAVALLAFAPFAGGQVDPGPAESELPPVGGVEVPDLRTATSRTFRQKDGTFVTEVFAAPIHYEDASGRLRPIDNTLVASDRSGYALENKANRYSLALPRSLGQGPVRFAVGEEWVTFQLRGARSASEPATPTGTKAVFADALQGVTVDYVARPAGVKETLTLRSASAPSTFVFDLELSPGLSAEENDAGGVDVVSAQAKEAVFSFAPPFMEDASGGEEGFSTAVDYELAKTVSGLSLVVSADRKWLQDPARVWPVRVDPTVVLPDQTASQDCHINSGNPTTVHCNMVDLKLGFGGGDKRRLLLKFPCRTSCTATPSPPPTWPSGARAAPPATTPTSSCGG